MNLNTFKKQYANPDFAFSMFMRTSALSWLEYAQKASNGKFKPDIDRIMKFSDAERNYEFDYDRKHTSINPNVTVGELLCVAAKLLARKPPAPYWDDESDGSEQDPVSPMEKDGIYIVKCLMLYPFTYIFKTERISES